MLNTIGSITTSVGMFQPPPIERAWCLVHSMGSGVMASVTALGRFAGIPTVDCSALDDEALIREVAPFEAIVFQGWTPRFHQVIERLRKRPHRFLVQWHTAMSGLETMGEGKIFAEVFAHPRIERILWTHPEVATFGHPRFMHLPNVAVTDKFGWLSVAPVVTLDSPDELHLLQPTINRPVKNAMSTAFAALMAIQAGVKVRLHVTDAFGNGERCGPALRAMLGKRLTVHPPLPVRSPRWGSLIRSANISSHLSFTESYCYAAIESIVAGVPGILSRGLPFASQMTNEAEFLVVDPTDVPGICQAIRTLDALSSEERGGIARAQMGVFRAYNRACAERLVATLLELGVDTAPCREGLSILV